MAVNFTYSLDSELTRTTKTLTKQRLFSWVEAVTGLHETVSVVTVAPGATEVIGLGTISVIKAIFCDLKIEGGTDDYNAMITFTNQAAVGVAVQDNEIRFGSKLIVLDCKIETVSITNLDTLNAIICEVRMLGE
jgi:hypothetical protein